jgi:hypothetical protein
MSKGQQAVSDGLKSKNGQPTGPPVSVSVARGRHPQGSGGWCSSCKRKAVDGVRLDITGREWWVFLCLRCARRIGKAAK